MLFNCHLRTSSLLDWHIFNRHNRTSCLAWNYDLQSHSPGQDELGFWSLIDLQPNNVCRSYYDQCEIWPASWESEIWPVSWDVSCCLAVPRVARSFSILALSWMMVARRLLPPSGSLAPLNDYFTLLLELIFWQGLFEVEQRKISLDRKSQAEAKYVWPE